MYVVEDRVEAWHGGLHLGSLFQPVVDLRTEQVVGHRASLSVRLNDETFLTANAPFDACDSATQVVHLDRLCRTLHALNFLAQHRHTGGYLQVAVHPRHLQAVSNQHGLVYEAILKRCGLGPGDIVLDIEAGEFDLNGHGAHALASYRHRGYRLAVTAPEHMLALPAILALRPDILRTATADPGLAASAGLAGTLVEASGIDDDSALRTAQANGADLGTGSLFGEPERTCRPTHTRSRNPYNPPSSYGARP